ncbi:MAG: CU044_2847 family protein [Egibacteraceae bacterium]
MPAPVVRYTLDDGTVVRFEAEPTEGFRPAGPNEVVGKLREAIGPAVEGAKVVLDKVKEAGPDTVEVKFGVKASGTMSWLVAKAASEGNFEITLTWNPDRNPHRNPDRSPGASAGT